MNIISVISKLPLLTTLLVLTSSFAYGGNIKGKIVDGTNGTPLPGATIVIDGTNHGVITDLRGEFILTGITTGEHRLIIRFIGYETETLDVVVDSDKPTEVEVRMFQQSIQGQEVVVTVQAAGQRAAINQQINSNSLTNVVSAQRIQEVPESNAAEAVGRLPGVSLKGGSLVIRGLSPHYNKIQIDGADMASTSFTDRSSSLSMISQYMLEGIEMTKTAMADQDADVFGARVNLMIKKAPVKPLFELLFQNGYNTLSQSFANQKFVASGSKRFFDNRFGIFALANYERANTASNSMSANYFKSTQGVDISSLSLNNFDYRMKGRGGASVVMDYKSGLTKIKMSNFFNKSSRDLIKRSLNYASGEESEGRSLNMNTQETTVLTSSLRLEKVLERFEFDGGVMYSYSKNDIPEEITARGLDIAAIADSVDWRLHPIEIPKYSSINLEDATLMSYDYSFQDGIENKYAADLNIKTNIRLGSGLSLELKFGAKYKHQIKSSDNEDYNASLNIAYFQNTRNLAHEYINWFPPGHEAGSQEGGLVAMDLFLDPNYINDDFLLGDYSLTHMLDMDRVKEFHDFMWANPGGYVIGGGKPYYKVWKDSYSKDYHGFEDYIAAYIQPTFSIGSGNELTFIPGVRYEKNKTSYTGFRLPSVDANDRDNEFPEFARLDVTRERENGFILPMIHLIYRPVKWMSLKSAYTHTLSRPKFSDLIPSWNVGSDNIAWNNPYLEPSLSKNLDLHASIHGPKIGLFGIGVFRKTIEGLIFSHGETRIMQEDLENNFYDGLQENNEYTNMDVAGFAINYEMNNPYDSYLKGLELEYQSNFYFLPGIFSGLVLNANYTLFDSEAKYPRVIRTLDYQTFQYTYTDTFNTDRLLDQATHIFNLMLGFDYNGFSIRGSVKYTDDLFSGYSEEPFLRTYTDHRIDFDISIRQSWANIGLTAFGNLTNLTRSRYVTLNAGSGFPKTESYGGLGVEIGLRYRFSKH